jgi:hypothetical protein
VTGEIVVTAAGRRVRRMVGPTAWVVLECLVADACTDEGGVVALASSVRGLAVELGLGRDAVASAVEALAVAGLVRVETSRSSSGRFGASRYVVAATDALYRLDPARPPASTTSSPPASCRHEREQLTLLDAFGDASGDRPHEAQTHATSSTRPAAARRGGSGHRGG